MKVARLTGAAAALLRPCARGRQGTVRVPCIVAYTCSVRHAVSCPGTVYSTSSASATPGTSTDDASVPKKTYYSKLGMDGFTDATYNQAADMFLEELESVLDDIDHPEMSDLSSNGGVLNLDTTTRGSYIINKQAPNVQLWLSSPISGPHHYDMVVVHGDGDNADVVQWVCDHDGHSLKERLEEELSDIFEQDVRLPTC